MKINKHLLDDVIKELELIKAKEIEIKKIIIYVSYGKIDEETTDYYVLRKGF